MSVLLNDGTGSFENRRSFSVGNFPRGVAVADLSGDGSPEIVTHNENEEVLGPPTASVLFGRGDGTFGPATEVPTVPGGLVSGYARSVTATDFDGDGAIDLAFGFELGRHVSILFNDGKGEFSEPVCLGDSKHTGFFAAGDIDGNGIDLAGSAGTCHLNEGGRVFSPVQYGILQPRALGCDLADMDGDGDPDLVVAIFDREGEVQVFENESGAFVGLMAAVPVGDRPVHLIAEDLDRDGRIDIAVVNRYSHSVSIVRNLGQLQLRVEAPLEVAPQPRWIVSGDFNGDGRTDLAAASHQSHVVSILIQRSPDRDAHDRNQNGILDECEFFRGDPNGDGHSDLADVLFLFDSLFLGGPSPACAESADVDDDGLRNIVDPIYLLRFLYSDGSPPGPPGIPALAGCTPDTGNAPFLGCDRYDDFCR